MSLAVLFVCFRDSLTMQTRLNFSSQKFIHLLLPPLLRLKVCYTIHRPNLYLLKTFIVHQNCIYWNKVIHDIFLIVITVETIVIITILFPTSVICLPIKFFYKPILLFLLIFSKNHFLVLLIFFFFLRFLWFCSFLFCFVYLVQDRLSMQSWVS